MGVIVDASVLIGAERQEFDMDGLLADLGDEIVTIAAITASELLHGVERSRDAATEWLVAAIACGRCATRAARPKTAGIY